MNYGCTNCHSNLQPLNIPLGPFARDERLGFIEHVLNVLDEDRFGRRGTNRLTSDMYDLPEWLTLPVDDTLEHFCDLTERLRIHNLVLYLYYSRIVTQTETITSISKSASATGSSSPTWPRLTSPLPIPLARGSPLANGSCTRSGSTRNLLTH